MSSFIFTSESVTEGHPDKVCDTIADRVLDAHLSVDPKTRINIEALAKSDHLVLSGEITSNAEIDIESIARDTIRDIGYVDPEDSFNADQVKIIQVFTKQALEIDQGVSRNESGTLDQGAGDQGMMFGFATKENDCMMPTPIYLAHKITRALSDDRKSGRIGWLKPDGKAQVSVQYQNGVPTALTDVVVSCQHAESASRDIYEEYVRYELLPAALGDWMNENIKLHINPTGSFIKGGPSVDSGLTGRKIIVDTYGGFASHGGGSFSGKDASKVDRSGAYFARYLAKKAIKNNMADRVEIQISYAIGEAEPISVYVNTAGTGDQQEVESFVRSFDFRPAAIIEQLDLLSPIFHKTTNYGHFGKSDLPWE